MDFQGIAKHKKRTIKIINRAISEAKIESKLINKYEWTNFVALLPKRKKNYSSANVKEIGYGWRACINCHVYVLQAEGK